MEIHRLSMDKTLIILTYLYTCKHGLDTMAGGGWSAILGALALVRFCLSSNAVAVRLSVYLSTYSPLSKPVNPCAVQHHVHGERPKEDGA